MAPAVASNGPRYAPDDPTLPKPWRGLIDGSTGYLYYWNPETNVTQYDRPVSGTLPPPPPGPPPGPPPVAAISSSVQVQQQQRRSSNDDDGRHAGSRSHQHQSTKVHGHSVQNSRTSARGHGSSDVGGGSSAEAYRRQHEITVTGNDIPAPYTTFESAGFSSEILKEVHHAGFSAPTPIQAQSWPIVIKGRDIVAIAKTGSGKTLGYLIPGFIHIKNLRNNSKMGPTVLVLAPTRELATQIQDEADKFCRSSRISCTCVYGGAPKGPQLRDLDRGVDVVVATPGRLNDILEMRKISLRQVSYLVLDEADRMLDMGFEPQIRKIVKEIPHRRQTLMFTATWPKEVRKIAADLLASPVQVNIGGMGELVANKAITQHVEVITPMEKQRRLEQILRAQEPGSKVIIFCSTKRMCDQLSHTLTRRFGAAAIHGDKSQVERDRVLSQFRTGKSPILVATDVAARGLDIKDIRVVINYDFPTGVEDYVHRIGRTGRAGATGESYTFFCDQDSKYASDLVKILEGAGQHVPPELRGMVRGGRYGGGKSRRRWRSTSGTRDGGRSQGGRNDSSYGGRGGRGPQPSAGRSDNSRGGRGHSDNEPRDRYDRGHEVDARSRHDTSDRKTRGRGRSRSLTPSPKKGRVGRGSSRSRSRSRSWDHGRSRSKSCSRSRSRSPSVRRGLKKRGRDVELTRGQSPPPKRKEPPVDNNHHDRDPVHSPSPYYDQQQRAQQRSLPNSGGDSMREEGRHDRSPSPWEKRSRSPYDYKDNNGGLGQSASPAQWDQKRSPSPHYHPDEAEEPTKGPVRLPAKFPDNGEEEEEGMIPAEDEEDGMIPPEETGRASLGIVIAQEPNSCADGEQTAP